MNVGGDRHEILRRTLLQMPRTRLGRLASLLGDRDLDPADADSDGAAAVRDLCDDVSSFIDVVSGATRTEYFFDRHPRTFAAVAEFYRTDGVDLDGYLFA